MSTYLWKYFLEDDLDSFRKFLAGGAQGVSFKSPGHGTAVSALGLPESPHTPKGKGKALQPPSTSTSKGVRAAKNVQISRLNLNLKDARGVNLLLQIASSTNPNAYYYASALLQLPLLDLYAQDLENGWTALHRALYFGNIGIARTLLSRDSNLEHSTPGNHGVNGLIKVKDREGNSPFDVYGSTIANRNIKASGQTDLLLSGDEDNENEQSVDGDASVSSPSAYGPSININGDELFMFGSNKESQSRREHAARGEADSSQASNIEKVEARSIKNIPAVVQYAPIQVKDLVLSKLHTAVLTTDPEANLYICGFGPGGRLGTGDEATRFKFTCIHGGALAGRKITTVSLGLNHTLAVDDSGEVFSWGGNAFGQLGYALPASTSGTEEASQLTPRQIFGPLKREHVIGCAASSVHSVLFTSTSLYTFGKNDGQLGIVDSDARTLEYQTVPRKVAASLFSSTILIATAIDKATACLLDKTFEVWVFANYGYTKVSFELGAFSNYFLKASYTSTKYNNVSNHIVKIVSGGDSICALAHDGSVYSITISQKLDVVSTAASTTNPAKIRGAVSPPHIIWSLRKSHMAARDIDVGQDGSIILCTESGSVWRRVKRTKIKHENTGTGATMKFSRIPRLTRVVAVRSNAFGTYGAVRRDCDVLRSQVVVGGNKLWKDIFPLLPLSRIVKEEHSDTENPMPRLWAGKIASHDPARIRHAVITAPDIEALLAEEFGTLNQHRDSACDITMGSTVSGVRIPIHSFVLAARSGTFRKALPQFRNAYNFDLAEVLNIGYGPDGRPLVLLQGVDILTLLNLILYIYTDTIIDVWHHSRNKPALTLKYRQVRVELMKLAAALEMKDLEQAARMMNEPSKIMHRDFELAFQDPDFFDSADMVIQLAGTTVRAHSALVCQRCPFFDGLFYGRSGGTWLASRRDELDESEDLVTVDLEHIDPNVFQLVLRHIYGDTGEELFHNIVAQDLDGFLDFAMDVLSVANELMLDRLSQICQKIIGNFVNNRNVCQLLNAIAPCSVTEFKDAALEYICLNLEGMMENHLLDELDEDLMLELDEVVRQNQLACLPFAKSGRAEAELLDRYPELAVTMAKAKQVKIDSMALRSRLHEDDAKSARTPTSRPSTGELMFDMEEDQGTKAETRRESATPIRRGQESPKSPFMGPESPSASLPRDETWFDSRGKALSPVSPEMLANSLKIRGSMPASLSRTFELPQPLQENATGSKPAIRPQPTPLWNAQPLQSEKLDMKAIMAQASEVRKSNISSGLAQSPASSASKPAVTKLSQKDRKKQLQQAQQVQHLHPSFPSDSPAPLSHGSTGGSPWKVASTGSKINLKDVLQSPQPPPLEKPSKRRPSPNPSLTMRQTVPGNNSTTKKVPLEPSLSTATAVTQSGSVSSPIVQARDYPAPSASLTIQKATSQATNTRTLSPAMAIQGTRHEPRAVEPSLQLSMADILAQQQIEKDVIRGTTAKRSLQEIQAEQAFQEWWDQEEALTRAKLEEEAAANKAAGSRGGRSGRGGRAKARGPSRGGLAIRRGGRSRSGRTDPGTEHVTSRTDERANPG